MKVKIVPERSGNWCGLGLPPACDVHTRDVYYTYDLQGRLRTARFGSDSGEGVTQTYDGFGRLASQRLNLGGTDRTLSYQSDAAGNRTHVIHPDTTTFIYGYDALSRPVSITSSPWVMIGIPYYAHGKPSGISRANGAPTNFGYDA